MLKRINSLFCAFAAVLLLIAPLTAHAKTNSATISVEAFSLGSGYLVKPTNVNLSGKNAAQVLLKVLHSCGYSCFYGGSDTDGFYLSYVASGTNFSESYEGYKNSFSLLGAPTSPKKINLSVKIPNIISSKLEDNVTYFNKADDKNFRGLLGEYMFTNGSGWMISINNKFIDSSLESIYLKDGDVMRIQYSLCFGADIGASDEKLSLDNFYKVNNKDNLTKKLALASDKSKNYNSALAVATKLNSSLSEIKKAELSLENTKTTIGKTTVAKEKTTTKKQVSSITKSHTQTQKTTKLTTTTSKVSTEKFSTSPSTKKETNLSQKTKEDNFALPIIFGIIAIILVCLGAVYYIKRGKVK